MRNFTIHSPESISRAAAAMLNGVAEQLGFLPNIFAVLGNANSALAGFIALNQHFAASSLTPIEREIVQSATSVENQCAYCVAGHSAFTRLQELDEAPIEAIRAGQPIADEKLEALRVLTRLLVVNKGKLTDQQVTAFIDAGYRSDQIFEVILGITVKNFSNLASAISHLPLDQQFEPFAWIPSNTSQAAA